MFWCDRKRVFKFARIACNHVLCTWAGVQWTPLLDNNNFVTFIKLNPSQIFCLYLTGGWYPPAWWIFMFNKNILIWWKLCIICRGEPRSPIVLVAKPKRTNNNLIFHHDNYFKIKNLYRWTDFSIGSIGEHGSPLHWDTQFSSH